jgi:hypothetical protein
MKVLITEQLPGSSTIVAGRLGAAGHHVTYCHRPGQPSIECVGLAANGRCPLTEPDIAVVVDARSHRGPLTVREFGAVCALRHGTPLVVAGPVPDVQVSPWRDADVRCEPDDVVNACDDAAAPVGAAAHRVVAIAATRVLSQSGSLHQQLSVALHLRKGIVTAVITTRRRLPPPMCEAIRTVVRTSLAPHTPTWQYAEVRYRTPSST